MGEKFVDSSLLDKAILFATNAHKNTERRGKGFPYILHPLEVAAICSTITNDQEILAAAVLHDTVEDTDTTIDQIKREFGERVASIVGDESETPIANKSLEDSWEERKIAAINHLKNADRDSKIVALGDKLSNIRAIAQDFSEMGSEVWNKFHVKDVALHEWHYRGLADALSDLSETYAYKEFVKIINTVFKK